MKRGNVLFIGILCLFLVVVLFLVGVINFNDRVDGKKTNEDVISGVKESEIMIEGSPIKIKTRTYASKEGFKVDYDIDYFDYEYVNDELRFVLKKDKTIYVGIKTVNERGIEDDDTKYITKDNISLRVRKVCDNETSEYNEGIKPRLNSLVDSIEIIR